MKARKNTALFHFLGNTDELNSHLGLVKTLLSDDEARQFIEAVQKTLMKIMSHAFDTANKEYLLSGDEVAALEKEIEKLAEKLPKITEFVLPGRNVTEAQIHIARAVARRAERRFFNVDSPLCPNAGEYLNKLSDYLFLLSQYIY